MGNGYSTAFNQKNLDQFMKNYLDAELIKKNDSDDYMFSESQTSDLQ